MAAAVPEECYQQDEEIQTGRLTLIVNSLSHFFEPGLGPPLLLACFNMRSSGMLYSTYSG